MPKTDVLSSRSESNGQQLVTLTVTQDCNLRCRYCYEPNKSRDSFMSLATAKQAVTYFMELDNEFNQIHFEFFGGEPTLAFELIRNLVDWFHTKRWKKGHMFSMGTNGTNLTEEMKPWLILNKSCFKCGISLDGNKTAHDINRSNSYDRVMKNLPFFMEHWPEQPVKMTISAETIPYVADSIIEFEEMGIPFSANIVFEDIWGSPEQKSVLLEIYAQQLDRLVEYYVVHPELYPARLVDVHFEYILDEIHSKDEAGRDCVRWCGAGHEMVVVEVDGSFSPCHRFSPWVTGKPSPSQPVNRQTVWKPKGCSECRLNYICPVCAGFNWQLNGDTGIRTTYHCDAFKLEVQASAKLAALRLLHKSPEDFLKLSSDETYQTRQRIDALLTIAENGV